MEGITLDESARIRVLPADELAAAEELQNHTDRFLETLERLREVPSASMGSVCTHVIYILVKVCRMSFSLASRRCPEVLSTLSSTRRR